MKLLSILLCLLLLTGCASTMVKLETAEEVLESKLDAAEEKIETQVETVTTIPAPTTVLLTEADAQAIALEHAGLTADRVEGLRVSYEVDDGVPEYDVDFRVGMMEYDYTIHAETGAILSYEVDD